MAQVIRTKSDSSSPVSIVGAGYLHPYGERGVLLEDAAKGMPELQDKDGEPLTGSALTKASKEWAEANGLEVGTITKDEADELYVNPGDLPPLHVVGHENYLRTYPDASVEDEAIAEPPSEATGNLGSRPPANGTEDDNGGTT